MSARMTVSRLGIVAATLFSLGWAACTPRNSKSGAADAGPGLREQAAGVVREYQSATNDEDADRLAALYDDAALLLPPDGGVVRGRAEIADFWREGLERGLSMDTVRIVTNDSVGYVVGTYFLAGTETAAPDSGKFILALARRGGDWKVAADIWNATPSDTEDDTERDPRTRVLTAIPVSQVSWRGARGEGQGDRTTFRASSPSSRAPRRAAGLQPTR